MKCCVECFSDEYLSKLISAEGRLGDCSFCGTQNVKVLPASDLRDVFEPLLQLYSPVEIGVHTWPDDHDASAIGESIDFLIDNDWRIWSDRFPTDRRLQMLKEIFGPAYDRKGIPCGPDLDEFWTDHPPFYHRSFSDEWADFSQHLRHERRFILDPDIAPASWLRDALDGAGETVAEGTRLYRSRRGGKRGEHSEFLAYPTSEMGAPPPDACRSGRANPPGIPFLYLATDPLTAVAEIRPWKGAKVSLGEVVLVKDVSVADLARVPYFETPFGRDELKSEVERRSILRHLGRALSHPIDPEAAEIAYVPTQYLTEVVRDSGCEGIRYPSALGPGENLVVFDPTAAKVTKTRPVKVTGVEYAIEDYDPRLDRGSVAM